MSEHTPHQPTAEQAPPADTGGSWQDVLIDEVVEHRQRLHALEAQSAQASFQASAFLVGFASALGLCVLHQVKSRLLVNQAPVRERVQ